MLMFLKRERQLAHTEPKHNDLQSQAIAAALHRARDISRMPDDGGESDLMGNI